MINEFVGGKFPHSLGNPIRCNNFREYYIANSVEDIEEFIKANNETNCYCSVYAYTEYTQTSRNKMSAIIDVLVYDFDDNECPDNAFNDLKIFLAWAKRHNINPRISYSGNKGFHAYIDIEPIKLVHVQETLRKWFYEFKKDSGLQTLDMSIAGDLERIIRIPNTINGKTGRYCIPLNPSIISFFTMKDIEILAQNKSDYVPVRVPVSGLVHNVLLEHDKIVGQEIEEMKLKVEEERLREQNSLFPGLKAGVPCLAYRDCLNNGVTSGYRNYAAAGITQKCKKDGLTFDKTFRTLVEFGNKCEPIMSESELKSVLNYHWNRDYSICTFFSKFSENCTYCVNRNF